MKTIALAILFATGCTQVAVAPETPSPDTTHSTVVPGAASATNSLEPTTPILSLLVGNNITPAARGKWCLADGTAPYTKVVIQDESIAAPIESQNAPLQKTVKKQAPATGSVTSNRGDSQFAIQWLSSGQKSEGQMTVQNGDTLIWKMGTDSGTFKRCD